VSTPEADELRRRAAQARRVGRAVQASSAYNLAAKANDDTWFGPTALSFRDELRRTTSALDHAADALRWLASRLETEAHQLDVNPTVR
jgi:hypothetical protein